MFEVVVVCNWSCGGVKEGVGVGGGGKGNRRLRNAQGQRAAADGGRPKR